MDDKFPEIMYLREGESLQYLLNQIKEGKIPKKEFKNYKVEWDYSNCYYEGDMPYLTFKYEK